MRFGEFKKSAQGMMAEAGLTIEEAKKCRLRIRQPVFSADFPYRQIRTDEKEIVGMQLDPDRGELIVTLADVGKEVA